MTVERQQVTGGGSAGRVTLRGARLGDDRVLGSPAAGADITEWLVAHGTVGLCALQLGVVERALELTSAYARDRVQFGRPIGSFQAVTQRLADAYIDVEAVRLTMWQAAWRLAAGLPGGTEVATAKFWAADAGHRVAHTAVHVHGGVGIDMGYPLHRYFTAAKRAEFALGGATSQLRRIGAALASDRPRFPGHVLVAVAVAVPQLTQMPGDKLLVQDLAGLGRDAQLPPLPPPPAGQADHEQRHAAGHRHGHERALDQPGERVVDDGVGGVGRVEIRRPRPSRTHIPARRANRSGRPTGS